MASETVTMIFKHGMIKKMEGLPWHAMARLDCKRFFRTIEWFLDVKSASMSRRVDFFWRHRLC